MMLRPPIEERRLRLMQKLIDQHQLAFRLTTLKHPTPYNQDFALLRPINPIGSHIFIHGRELFSEEAAQEYFALKDPKQFPASKFNEAVKEKIRRYLSPEGLEDRLYDYREPRDYVTQVAHHIAECMIDYPDVKFPEFPDITPQNATEQLNRLNITLEKAGIDLGELDINMHYPDDKTRAVLQAQHQKHAEKFLEHLEVLVKGTPYREMMRALREEVETHRWDPEIVRNFHAGVQAGVGDNANLAAIIAKGIEARTEKLLREAASQMNDPYQACFQTHAYQMSEMIVEALQPRVLDLLLRSKTPILISHTGALDKCADLLAANSIDWSRAAGVFSGGYSHKATISTPFIILTRNYIPNRMRGLIRHEGEHMRDLTRRKPLNRNRKELEVAIDHDSKRLSQLLMETETTVFNISSELQELIELRGYDMSNSFNQEYARTELNADLQEISECCARFMQPGSNIVYASRHSQLNEVIAVIADMKGRFGTNFLRAVLPELYKLFIQDRVQDERMRYDGAARD